MFKQIHLLTRKISPISLFQTSNQLSGIDRIQYPTAIETSYSAKRTPTPETSGIQFGLHRLPGYKSTPVPQRDSSNGCICPANNDDSKHDGRS